MLLESGEMRAKKERTDAWRRLPASALCISISISLFQLLPQVAEKGKENIACVCNQCVRHFLTENIKLKTSIFHGLQPVRFILNQARFRGNL